MAKNKMTDLRDHLFEALEALKDIDNPLALDRAKAISEVAQTIINSAKVEVDFVKAAGRFTAPSVFFGVEEPTLPNTPRRARPPLLTERD